MTLLVAAGSLKLYRPTNRTLRGICLVLFNNATVSHQAVLLKMFHTRWHHNTTLSTVETVYCSRVGNVHISANETTYDSNIGDKLAVMREANSQHDRYVVAILKYRYIVNTEF